MSHCPTCQMPVFKSEQICRRCGTDLEKIKPEGSGGGPLSGLWRALFQGWHPTGAKTWIVGGSLLLAVGLSYWNHVSEQRQLEERQAVERRLIEERAEAERRRVAEQKAAADKKAAAEKAAAEKASAAEKAAIEKTAAEKASAEKAAAEKAAAEKAAAEKAAAEKAAAEKAAAEKAAAEKAAAEKAATEKAAAEKAAAEKAAAEKAATEKAATEKAAAEKAATEKAAAGKAAADKKAAAEKAAADKKAAAEKAAADKKAAAEKAAADKKAAAEKVAADKKAAAEKAAEKVKGSTPTTWRDPLSGMSFVEVPAGRFEMGCGFWQERCDGDEKPVHPVRLNGFWLGQKEVTQAQWRAVMGSNPSRFTACGDDCPVEQVSWNDAQAFLAKLNQGGGQCRFRLPTEAEWEYACRSAGKPERYCGGNGSWSLGWVRRNSEGTTHPVGQKQANGLGLYDMSGNVWEWTADRYDPKGYAGADQENPQGPQKGDKRVIRGGSWHYYAQMQRSTARYALDPEFRHGNVGLRLVRHCP